MIEFTKVDRHDYEMIEIKDTEYPNINKTVAGKPVTLGIRAYIFRVFWRIWFCPI